MSERRPGSPPGIAVLPISRTSAGMPIALEVRVTNHEAEPRILTVTALGVDAEWLPLPRRSAPLMPGQDAALQLVVSPSAGTVPARYPLVIAVQAIDPLTQQVTSPTAMAEVMLVVDAPGQLKVDLQPVDAQARLQRRVSVLLTNTGSTPLEVALGVQSSSRAHVHLSHSRLVLEPGTVTRVKGQLRVARPRLFGQRARHAYTVTARSAGAARYAEGSLTEKAILGPGGTKVALLAALVAAWIALALIAIPRLAQNTKNQEIAGPPAASASAGTASPSGGSGSSGSGSGGSGGAGGSGGSGGAAASGSAGSAGGASPASANEVQLNGSVLGNAPAGVDVAIRPTSLVDEEAESATPVGLTTQSLNVHGLVPQSALLVDPPPAQTRSMVTGADGAWSFAGVNAPGYYLLTFAKPGYQTQRYVVNSAESVATQPLKVTLASGLGSLSGRIAGPGGGVGGAQITITDGTNTLTTSTTSTGSGVGDWSISGLSTPSTYLVTATRSGLGTESRVVVLTAGGAATASLTLRVGVASLVGNVQGASGGLGGATVTITDGTSTRTATTITDGPIGNYTLPALPAPGSYSVTISADGYQPQTGKVTLTAGQSQATLNTTLRRSTGSVSGVLTVPAPGKADSAGLVLSNSEHTYKILANSDGSFLFDGVEPGEDYVLTATLFGYTQQFAAVPAVNAAGQTKVNLTLVAAPNGGLPSTALIQVQGVQDSRTSGPINCTDAHGNAVTPCAITLTLLGESGKTTTCVVAGDGTLSTAVGTVAPVTGYLVPPGTSVPACGLAAGLHKMKVSAEGYEDAVVGVQVPLGAPTTPTPTVTVPTVTLYPAPHLTGTVTTFVGAATGLCVVAVTSGAAAPTGCGSGLVSTPVDAATSQYDLRLPAHGTYDIYILTPSGSEYVGVGPLKLTFGLGEVKPFSTALHRLGRVDLTLLGPDATGTTLTAAPDGTVVTITGPGNPPPATTAPNSNGQLRLTGLAPGSYHFAATVSGKAISGTVTNLGYDQEVTATLLPDPLAAVVGQITDTDGNGVGGSTVTLTGVVGYNGGSPIVGSPVTITTDGNGCFALTTTSTLPATSGACAGVATSARRIYSPIYSQISAQISAPGYQSSAVPSKLVNAGVTNAFPLQPLPDDFSGIVGVTTVPAPSLAATRVQVTQQPAGSGAISVSVAASGALTWTDSEYTAVNKIRPGGYTLIANLAGFSSATISFSCAVGTACAVPAGFTMAEFGSLVIRAAAGAVAVTGASFTLTDNGANPQTKTTDSSTNTVTFTGLTAGDSHYAVTIQAPGYLFESFGNGTGSLSCPAGSSAATSITIPVGAPADCTASLTRLGAITGTLSGAVGTSTTLTQPLNGATVTATKCAATAVDGADTYCTSVSGTPFSVTTGNLGAYSITGTAQLQGLSSGTWLLTATAFGYALPDVPSGAPAHALPGVVVAVPASPTADTAADVKLLPTPVSYHVTVTGPSGDALAGLSVTLTANGTTLTGTAAGPASAPEYDFAAVLPGPYSLQVSGGGAATSSTQVTVNVGASPQTFTLAATLNSNFVTGVVSGLQNGDATATPLDGVTVAIGTVSNGTFTPAKGTDGATLTHPSAGGGKFTFGTVPDGTFTVQMTRYGYLLSQQSVSVNHSNPPILPLATTLSRVGQQVVISVVAAAGDDLTGWVPTLTAADTGDNPANATLTGSGLAATATPNVYASTFNTVPYGCWAVTLANAINHYGTISLTSAPPTVAQLSCADTSVTVPGSGTSEVDARYTLDEEQLELRVNATAVAPDAAITTVALSISAGAGGSAVPAFGSFSVGAGGATAVWVKHAAYTVTATPADTTTWPAASTAALTTSRTAATAATVALSEVSGGISLTLTGATSAAHQSVTIAFSDGQGSPKYPTPIDAANNGPIAFSGLPPGTWTVTATAGALTATGTVTVTGTATTAYTLAAPS
ncbi:carboxypeptidase family protein [Jatrophihabitans sp. GAS493]|uniref:beta strand repeat-containing protein n=1 Tax=Jatrophihabitans sp. GAS493 TaxID=1907575 RepID=UPI000BB706A3|nr:carboxypeptidase-like regulatory domain-containing protein [Jatrophihabitans sp. GAS493]SOD70955.1 carboxypeptidase family protein [Jatrophihabitans sp. GAS493]